MQYLFAGSLNASQVERLIEDKCNENDNWDVAKLESYVLPQYPDSVLFWILLKKKLDDFNDPYDPEHFSPPSHFDAVDGPPF